MGTGRLMRLRSLTKAPVVWSRREPPTHAEKPDHRRAGLCTSRADAEKIGSNGAGNQKHICCIQNQHQDEGTHASPTRNRCLRQAHDRCLYQAKRSINHRGTTAGGAPASLSYVTPVGLSS